MGLVALAILVGASSALVVLLHVAQRLLLSRRTPAALFPLPPVSVLKPLCGTDPGLEANLTTIFRQDHPAYEVILGAADADDPALPIARRVALRHPHVTSSIVVDARTVGANPKVNNLANLLRHARHEVVLISDSNVAAPASHVREMAAILMQEPGVGLVSAPFRGVSAGTVGSTLEALQLNTFVMGGVAAMHVVVGGVCVVGKAMMLRRSDLDAIGGFAALGRHLAEDQVCGEDLRRLGRRLALVPTPADNVLGRIAVRTFVTRHLRWARIRRWMAPAGYAGEILLNPIFLATVGALALRTTDAAAVLGATVLFKSSLDAVSERRLGVRRPLWLYPLLVVAKDLITGAVWPVPFVARRVTWRGNTFELGPRTTLRLISARPASAPRPIGSPARVDCEPEFLPAQSPIPAAV